MVRTGAKARKSQPKNKDFILAVVGMTVSGGLGGRVSLPSLSVTIVGRLSLEYATDVFGVEGLTNTQGSALRSNWPMEP